MSYYKELKIEHNSGHMVLLAVTTVQHELIIKFMNENRFPCHFFSHTTFEFHMLGNKD